MVCLGNICRSPLAHGILESKLPSDLFFIDSAGTGNYHIGSPPDERSIEVAKQNNIYISSQKCRQFQISDFDDFDIIYVMDESNYRNVTKLARNSVDKNKVHFILDSLDETIKEVPDPYYGNHKDFESVFDIIDSACSIIASDLTNAK